MLHVRTCAAVLTLLAGVVDASAQSTAKEGASGPATLPRTPAEAPESFREVGDAVEQILLSAGIPSAAVGVARDGTILWEQAFGWADREAVIRATPDTPYVLGSLSKSYVATGLMVLVQEGTVDLERPINDYLGEVRLWSVTGEEYEPTVRQVADHTAGLPGDFWDMHFEQDDLPPLDNEDLVRRYGYMDQPPGASYRYSNLGFAALGHLIEVQSGLPLGEYLRERLFAPLGLTRTQLGRDLAAPTPAVGYGAGPGTIGFPGAPVDGRISRHAIGPPAAGDVRASLHDVLRFGLFHLGHVAEPGVEVLKVETLEAMRATTGAATYGTEIGWGWRTTLGGLRFVMHEGGSAGVRTRLILVPQEGLVIAILTNRFHAALEEISDLIVQAALPGHDLAWDWGEKPTIPPTSQPPRAPLDDAPPAGRWRGTLDPHGAALSLELNIVESDQVELRLGEGIRRQLFRPSLESGRLRGYAVDLPPQPGVDWLRAPSTVLVLELAAREGRLRGTILAQAEVNVERDCEYSVMHWVDLQKVE